MFNSKHKKKMSPAGLQRERVSRRQAIKNGFIARAGARRVKKKKK